MADAPERQWLESYRILRVLGLVAEADLINPSRAGAAAARCPEYRHPFADASGAIGDDFIHAISRIAGLSFLFLSYLCAGAYLLS
jgi:hypothetical protein